MKVNDLIKALEQVKKQFGNKEVLVSTDPAGNNYSDLGKRALNIDVFGNKVLIFPERTIFADDLK